MLIRRTLILLLVLLWLPSLSTPGGIDANFFVPVPLLLLLLVSLRRGGLDFRVGTSTDRIAVMLLIAAAVGITSLSLASMLYAENPTLVFRVITGELFGLAILAGVLSLPDDERTLTRLTDLFVWGAVLSSAFVAVANYVPALNAFAFGTADRSAAFFKHPNQFGMALTATAPLLFAKCIVDERKIFRLAQLALLYLGLVFSGSKTNLVLCAAIAFLVFGIGLWRTGFLRRHRLAAFGLFGLALVACVVGFNALAVLNPRAQQLIISTASGDAIVSWDARLTLWRISLEDGFAHPLFGVGAGQYVSGTDVNHSHNVFLDYFRTLGSVGVAFLCIQILGTLLPIFSSVLGRRNRAAELDITAIGLGFGVLGYILANQFSDSFGPSTVPLMWLGISLLLYDRRIAVRSGRANVAPPAFQHISGGSLASASLRRPAAAQ